jgi:hypothetical protein
MKKTLMITLFVMLMVMRLTAETLASATEDAYRLLLHMLCIKINEH